MADTILLAHRAHFTLETAAMRNNLLVVAIRFIERIILCVYVLLIRRRNKMTLFLEFLQFGSRPTIIILQTVMQFC